jgi:hypothetical protein
MKRVGLVLALLIIAAGAWVDWSYRAARTSITEIGSRLPSEEALNAMPLDETVETLKQATADCRRIESLEWNPLTRLLKGNEIKSLTEQCELIKERQKSLEGP